LFITQNEEKRLEFYDHFFLNMWKGLQQAIDSILHRNHNVVLDSYFECLCFVIFKYSLFVLNFCVLFFSKSSNNKMFGEISYLTVRMSFREASQSSIKICESLLTTNFLHLFEAFLKEEVKFLLFLQFFHLLFWTLLSRILTFYLFILEETFIFCSSTILSELHYQSFKQIVA
jgi:hypothetical protein